MLVEMIILIISALITSSISAVIGMGGGIILLGIMAIFIPDGFLVIALHGMIQLFSNSTRTFDYRDSINKKLILEFFVGAVVGLIFSALIVFFLMVVLKVDSASKIKIDFMKAIIGILSVSTPTGLTDSYLFPRSYEKYPIAPPENGRFG